MNTLLKPLLVTLIGFLRSRVVLHMEILALRQQLAMLADRDPKRMRFRRPERAFWVLLYRCWPDCLQTLQVFQPDTLVRWHRKGFPFYWRWKTCRGQDGRLAIDQEVRELIRTMSRDNVGWGAPRIHGELRMLGIDISQYVERLIGSIRRECLNHVIVVNERHLRRILRSYFTYYHDARTHLALAKKCPKPRSIEPPNQGRIVSLAHVGGLHHEYRRVA